ncbi:AraC family transcriptional regulator [Paenibacillus tarimensis]
MAAYSESGKHYSEEVLKPNFYRFILIESGKGWVKVGDRNYTASPGQLFILPAGVTQSYGTVGEESVSCYWCHFRADIGNFQLFEILNLPLCIDVDDHDYVQGLFLKMKKVLAESTLASGLRLKAVLLELLSYYLDRCDFQAEMVGDNSLFGKLDEVLTHVETNLDRTIHVEELARIAFLHPNYFIEFFKSTVGCSPIQYVNQRRLERAKQLLEQTEEHVSEIAKRVGMQNHYLSRMFKSYTGLSPSRYRQHFRAMSDEHIPPEMRLQE